MRAGPVIPCHYHIRTLEPMRMSAQSEWSAQPCAEVGRDMSGARSIWRPGRLAVAHDGRFRSLGSARQRSAPCRSPRATISSVSKGYPSCYDPAGVRTR